MQQTLMHLEHARTVAGERADELAGATATVPGDRRRCGDGGGLARPAGGGGALGAPAGAAVRLGPAAARPGGRGSVRVAAAGRRWLAGVLARAAERLDPDALSPHWRRP